MSDFNRGNNPYQYPSQAQSSTVDLGLRSFMISVYNIMAMGLVVTGVVAYFTFTMAVTNDQNLAAAHIGKSIYLTQFGQAIFLSPLKWLVLLSPLAFILVLTVGLSKFSPATAKFLFLAYSAAVGISLSSIFLIYTQASINQAFFITAAAFGGLSLYGYTTKRDLGPIGTFACMSLIGLMIIGLVLMFFPSSMGSIVYSILILVVFAALTAYDTQMLKSMYLSLGSQEAAQRASVYGALQLYLDFINIFMAILNLTGDRRS